MFEIGTRTNIMTRKRRLFI